MCLLNIKRKVSKSKKVQSVQTPDRRFPSSSLPLSPHTPASSQTPNQSQWLRGFTCLHPFLGNWTIHGYLCSLPGNFTFAETALSEQYIPSFICWISRFTYAAVIVTFLIWNIKMVLWFNRLYCIIKILINTLTYHN